MAFTSDSLELVARLRRSDGESRNVALAATYQCYFARLLGLLRLRVPAYLARRQDPEDLAQSAWASFVGGLNAGQLDLEGRETLWPLIAQIALCKYHDLVASAHRQKRDIRREASLDAADGPAADLRDARGTPVEEAAAGETVELLYARLGDDRQQLILALHLSGYLVREIAEEIKLSERTVKRVLSKVREFYAEVVGEPGSAPK
jgi:RNA polymerase sigma factor (sigma-70 family)